MLCYHPPKFKSNALKTDKHIFRSNIETIPGEEMKDKYKVMKSNLFAP